MKKTKVVMLFAFLFVSGIGFAQKTTEQTKIENYLKSTIEYGNKLIVSNSSQNVLASDIFESKLTFNTGDKYNNVSIEERYFFKTGDKFTPFKYKSDILSSKELIESIKAKNFKLKTEEDGVAFQSILSLMDNERGLGFFIEENTWYFIRSEFFSEIKAYIVNTDSEGQISSVVYKDELKKELPEKLLRSGDILPNNNSEKAVVSEKDSIFMHDYLLKKANYKFEITPLNFYSLNKISTILINKCSLVITQGENGMTSTSTSSFMLVSNDNEYIKQSSIDGLLEMPLFLKSLQKKYKIKTEDDARLFQYVLDDLSPVSKSDIELKTFYKKDNMWVFVREKSFDDLKGYILLVNNKYKVSDIEYATISEESFIKIKMKDPNYVVDYKFKLEEPATNSVTLKKGEGLSVKISFDADVVNAKGAWILTYFDGNEGGMYAGTSIDSPYTDGLTGPSLNYSKYHTVEYYLMESGEKDIEKALDSIKIDIKVE